MWSNYLTSFFSLCVSHIQNCCDDFTQFLLHHVFSVFLPHFFFFFLLNSLYSKVTTTIRKDSRTHNRTWYKKIILIMSNSNNSLSVKYLLGISLLFSFFFVFLVTCSSDKNKSSEERKWQGSDDYDKNLYYFYCRFLFDPFFISLKGILYTN